MKEKIPNYYVDCFLAYCSFKKRNKSFKEFYMDKKDTIHNGGMSDTEIKKALEINSKELKKTFESAYNKIRYYEKEMKLGLCDKNS